MRRLMLAVVLFASVPAVAAQKTYQVTGVVTDLSDTTIVVTKGKEKFEMARPAGVKVTGDLKKGSKVTVEYSITAATIMVKDAAKAKAP